MLTHDRTEGTAAAAELRHARRAVTRPAGALLLVYFLARTPDFGAVLDLVRAGASLGELIAHHAVDQIHARLEAENLVVEFDVAGRFAVKRRDVDLHGISPPGFLVARVLRSALRWRLHRARGICPAEAPPSAARASPHRAHRSSRRDGRVPRLRPGSARAKRRSARRAGSASSRVPHPCAQPFSCS